MLEFKIIEMFPLIHHIFWYTVYITKCDEII